jgi:acetolactate synthase I/II/III large subunit
MPRKKPSKTAPAQMTTAEAIVATLIAHGLDTIYALPGVQNDLLFEAAAHGSHPA